MTASQTQSESSYGEREAVVLELHSEQLKYYKSHGTRNRIQYYFVQSALLILSGLIPILVYASDYKLLQAVPAAIVGALAGMNSFFRFRENWIKNINAAHALSIELVKFKARSDPDYSLDLEPHVVLNNFLARIEAIAEAALTEWRTLVTMAPDPTPAQGRTQR